MYRRKKDFMEGGGQRKDERKSVRVIEVDEVEGCPNVRGDVMRQLR